MENYQAPPPPPPAPPARRGLLTWVVAGLGLLVLAQVCVAAVVFVAMPGVRDRAMAVFARPAGPPPPDSPGPAGGAERPASPILIEDNFDQPTGRWDQSLAQVADGELELRIDIPNYDGYALYLGPEQPEAPAATPAPEGDAPAPTPTPAPDEPPPFDAGAIDDFDLAVDVRQTAGGADAEYGIRFRQTGPGDYLLFSVSDGGYYRLLRVRNEQYEPIVPWTFDGRVRTGAGAVNRLRVTADGAAITGFINGAQAVQAKDEIDVGGQLTLGLQTYGAGAAVRFDNIEGRVGDVDLREDFANPAAVRWSSGGAQIADGAYEIVAGRGIQTWQQPLPTGSSRVGDFVLEVDATLQSGEGDGIAYGVMFGDGGSFDFYSLYIFPEGGLALLRSTPAGETQVLVPPVAVAAVKAGAGQPNTIRVEVTGATLAVSVNGEDLGQLELDEHVQGMVGLIVSSGGAGEVRVRFDNFRLEEQAP